MLKSARKVEDQASQELAKIIASEAAKVSAQVRARAIALYKEQQEQKTEADLQKAVNRFVATWKNKRSKVNARRLAKKVKQEAAKAAQARKKANAKARTAVSKAAALAKARTRKAEARTRAKAKKLKARVRKKA